MTKVVPEDFEEIFLQTLKEKQSIYIGKSILMSKEQMEKHSELILEIGKSVSKNLAYQYKEKDVTELESLAINIIIEKCGDIAYNTETNPQVMARSMYNKCKKCMLGKILCEKKKGQYQINEFFEKKIEDKNIETNNENSLDLEQWTLNKKQQDILKFVSNSLEVGYDYQEALENVTEQMEIDIEELIYEMEEIKQIIREDSERIA